MHVNGRHNIDQLLARMEAVRGRLDQDAQAAKQSVHEMTDWRNLVRKSPLASVAVAAVAGYFLVPKRRSQPVIDAKELERLGREHTVIIAKESTARPGLVSTVTAIAGAAFARAASNYLANKLNDFSQPSSHEET